MAMTTMVHFDYKVPQGKLVRVDADWHNGHLRAIKVVGDFFMHPETAIDVLADRLIGATLDDLGDRLLRWQQETSVELVGVSLEDVAHAISSTK